MKNEMELDGRLKLAQFLLDKNEFFGYWFDVLRFFELMIDRFIIYFKYQSPDKGDDFFRKLENMKKIIFDIKCLYNTNSEIHENTGIIVYKNDEVTLKIKEKLQKLFNIFSEVFLHLND
ncbi:MAG: hypothetical protein KatS3mg002_0420 [Candidatus Woesearchaeota archaeon]|nr:MAG: hypothetical protein KatS3mg002_0420 [Candidatus Woesearchaeota archaeon]